MKTIELSAACALVLATVVACVSNNRDVYGIHAEGGAGQGGKDEANGVDGGRGGAGASACPYEIVRVPDDPYGIFAYTLEPLESLCPVGRCPATVEEAVSKVRCDLISQAWQVTGCGYTHVGEASPVYQRGYVYDDATGQLVGAYNFNDVEFEPCMVWNRYAGMKPDTCFDVRWDGAVGAYVPSGGADSTFTELCEGMGGAGGQGPGGAGGKGPGGRNPGEAGGRGPDGAGGKGTAGVAGDPS